MRFKVPSLETQCKMPNTLKPMGTMYTMDRGEAVNPQQRHNFAHADKEQNDYQPPTPRSIHTSFVV